MQTRGKKPFGRLSLALIGLAVLYYALKLSAGERGIVDYTVIGVVCGAIAGTVFQLARSMHAAEGAAGVFHVLRVVALWAFGLLYTVWGRPEYDGTWRQWLGWVLVAGAVVESVRLHGKERALGRPDAA